MEGVPHRLRQLFLIFKDKLGLSYLIPVVTRSSFKLIIACSFSLLLKKTLNLFLTVPEN